MLPIRWSVMAISCVYCGGRHETSDRGSGSAGRGVSPSRPTPISKVVTAAPAAVPSCQAIAAGCHAGARPQRRRATRPTVARRLGDCTSPVVDSGGCEYPDRPILADCGTWPTSALPCVFEIDDATDADFWRSRRSTHARYHTSRAAISCSSCRSCTICCGRTPSTPGTPTTVVAAGPGSDRPRRHSGARHPHRATSCFLTAPPCGSTAARSATREPIDGIAVLHRDRDRARLAAALRRQRRRPPTSPPTSWPPSPILAARRG